jgi:hypothetical protein
MVTCVTKHQSVDWSLQAQFSIHLWVTGRAVMNSQVTLISCSGEGLPVSEGLIILQLAYWHVSFFYICIGW